MRRIFLALRPDAPPSHPRIGASSSPKGRSCPPQGRHGEGRPRPAHGPQRRGRHAGPGRAGGTEEVPFRPTEVRLLSVLASRAALALENHLYQKELIASERMAALGAMAGMLAHDFRNPMTVVRGHAEMLLEAGTRPQSVREQAQPSSRWWTASTA